MSEKVPQAVIHGRFQVLHNDHLKYLLAGKALCHRLVVGVTNPDPSHTRHDPADPLRSLESSNPLTYFERAQLLHAVLTEAGLGPHAFFVVPFPINLPELYHHYVPMDALFLLTVYDEWGRRKLARFQNMGLDTRVLWDIPPEDKGLSATTVRRRMAAGEPWEHLVPPAAARLLRDWRVPERLAGQPGDAARQA
ncbi:nicotinate-nucleotide adenylyltransferase [Desulfovibrio aerotolerans]|uniref:Nicotinate-nucleotide adenylyltransferase n=1 Tax=Solidesulfovibrio aerotolerans TaxID=295255 RepID=A0A7C9INB5_9BACT|nr:nicotinate-nucleotide adenylyltransferase [Solidesulfovibrio aerotolerans]MYL85261.1 nicotinate-nucleotide adenylyltransferase [Solidesulfovibrio aerotolerans]